MNQKCVIEEVLAIHSGLGKVCIWTVTTYPEPPDDENSTYKVQKYGSAGKGVAAKTNNLSFSWQLEFKFQDPHVEEKNQLLVFWSHIPHHTCMHTRTYVEKHTQGTIGITTP